MDNSAINHTHARSFVASKFITTKTGVRPYVSIAIIILGVLLLLASSVIFATTTKWNLWYPGADNCLLFLKLNLTCGTSPVSSLFQHQPQRLPTDHHTDISDPVVQQLHLTNQDDVYNQSTTRAGDPLLRNRRLHRTHHDLHGYLVRAQTSKGCSRAIKFRDPSSSPTNLEDKARPYV
jgi:hypothetical protein